MKHHCKTSWRVFLPGGFMLMIVCSVMYMSRTQGSGVKMGHDFVPIYTQDGKLEGFTHPVLVQAANKYRERENTN